MSKTMSQMDNWPIISCPFDGPVQRVLCHLRQSHQGEDLPGYFIKRLNLLRCQFCQNWCAKLGQHFRIASYASKPSAPVPQTLVTSRLLPAAQPVSTGFTVTLCNVSLFVNRDVSADVILIEPFILFLFCLAGAMHLLTHALQLPSGESAAWELIREYPWTTSYSQHHPELHMCNRLDLQ